MEKEIVVNNLLIKYLNFGHVQSGAGDKCLLFLHGWRSNKEVWQEIVNKVIKFSGYQVYAMDLPGFGKSSLPKRPLDRLGTFHLENKNIGWNVGDYALLVKEFIEKENLSNVILVGHSFGGRVGIKLASQFPKLVSKLVLVDSAGFVYASEHKHLVSFLAKITKPFFAPKFMQGLRKSIYSILGSEDYLATPELQETFKKVIAEDLSEDMRHITVPTLIIWGEDDKDTPVEFGRTMEIKIKNSKLKILPNAGHFSFLDKPEEFTKVLNEFI